MLSPDSICAAESTWDDAEPVSPEPRCTPAIAASFQLDRLIGAGLVERRAPDLVRGLMFGGAEVERGAKTEIEDRMVEAIMLGLRTARGIDRHQFASRFGQSVESQLDQRQMDLLVNSGHLISEDDAIRLSEEGIYLADEITRRLIK